MAVLSLIAMKPWQMRDRYAMWRELEHRVYLVGTENGIRMRDYGGEREREKRG